MVDRTQVDASGPLEDVAWYIRDVIDVSPAVDHARLDVLTVEGGSEAGPCEDAESNRQDSSGHNQAIPPLSASIPPMYLITSCITTYVFCKQESLSRQVVICRE